MALIFNNTEITRVYFNGAEQKVLQYNGTAYFGKRYTLTKNTSTGVTLTVNRTNSPNQRAATSSVSAGNTIYYGDVITITATAASGYSSPKLYVDIGDGNGLVQRTSPYTFTVADNVTYYGTATAGSDWETVWTGSNTYTSSGSFTVPGLAADGNVQVTANISTKEYYIVDESNYFEGNEYSGSVSRGTLPTSIYGNLSDVSLTRNGSTINFSFNEGVEYSKGYTIYEIPVSITITEVRRKA